MSPFVDCYWEGVFNLNAQQDAAFRMVPNACLEMIIHLDDVKCHLPNANGWAQTPDYMLIGLLTSAQQVRFIGKVPVFTIRFKPEALYHLFRVEGTEVRDRYVDTDALLDSKFRELAHRIREADTMERRITLAEHFLRNIVSYRKPEPDYVIRAAELMRQTYTVNIKDIAGEVCISQRQLERKFREVMGVSPKQYLHLTRINKVVRLLQKQYPLDLTSVAYHCGYFDQAHFIKDFKRITGYNPSIYSREKQRFVALPGQVNIGD